MMVHKFGLIIAVALTVLVSGCEEYVPIDAPVAVGGPKAPLTFSADLKKKAMDGAIAEQIELRCTRKFNLNIVMKHSLEQELQRSAGAQGYSKVSQKQIFAAFGEQLMQDTLLGYIARRNILVNQNATWCAAGAAEVAERTAIGKWLILQ